MDQLYDYIICGGGAAGISLGLKLADGPFTDKKILIIDKEVKSENDHTWCFWDSGLSDLDGLMKNMFSEIKFHSMSYNAQESIQPYKYKMLQASDYYAYAHEIFDNAPNIDILQANIQEIKEEEKEVIISSDRGVFRGSKIFKSFTEQDVKGKSNLFVAQHFRGWFIKSDNPIFDPNVATFMDFRIAQYGECRFFYVLPTSEHSALIEIAIFSNKVMEAEDYDPLIKNYISEYLSASNYTITEKEYGVIPMTDYPFWNHNTDRILHIGGAGGAIKASSGYAFKRILEHSDAIISCLKENKPLTSLNAYFSGKYYFYDQIFLDVILRQGKPADEIFANLFKHNKPQKIYKFLDGNTSLLEEVNIFRKMPIWSFLKGLIKQKMLRK